MPFEANAVLADVAAITVLLGPTGVHGERVLDFLGLPGLSDGQSDEIYENPGARGWVRLQLPALSATTVQMARLDNRTKWLEHDRPEGVEVFRLISQPVRPLLRRPTWSWSMSSRAVVPMRTVGFTDGARELFTEGIAWVQPGIDPIRFGPDCPTILSQCKAGGS
jgi:hypothetical protein